MSFSGRLLTPVIVAIWLAALWMPIYAQPSSDDEDNMLGNGDFEAIHGGDPADWKLTASTSVVSQEQNRFLRVVPLEGHLQWAEQVFDLDPSWKAMQLSARLRAQGVQMGEQSWQRPGVVGAFVGSKAEVLSHMGVRLDENGDWKTLSVEAQIPQDATKLRVNPDSFAKGGQVDIDEVQVIVTKKGRSVLIEGRSLYVDSSADAGGDGSEARPLNTIQAAAEVAEPGDTVVIASGIYRESIVPANSGRRGGMITYRAAEGAEVVVSGADLVTGEWKPLMSKADVWQAPVSGQFDSELNQAEQLLLNGQMMIEARTPNLPLDSMDPLRPVMFHMDQKVTEHGPSPVDGRAYRVTIHDDEMTAPDGTYDGALLYIWPRHGNGNQGGGWGFTAPARVVRQTEGELVVDLLGTLDMEHANKHHMYDGGEPYFLLLHEACLDTPGEWLRHDNTLLLIPPTGIELAHATTEIKRRDYAFNLTDRSYIRIEGLKIVAATISTDHHSGNYGRGYTTNRGRKDVAPAHHIELENLHLKYVNHFTDFTGWTMGQWVQTSGIVVSGRDHVMRNSFVEHTAGNGILVIGERNLIENNLVHDTNYSGTFAAGICMGMESTNRDTTVRHNTVWASGNDGVMAQRLWSSRRDNPARIHHNYISEFGMLTRDVGGIKVVGFQPEVNGTRWDHNYVSDGGPWSLGLYQDYTGGHLVDHNVVWNTEVGLNINSGRGHSLFNNTLLGYERGLSGGSGINEKLINNLLASPYSLRFLNLKESEVSHNIEGVTPAMFMNPVHGDWRPKSGSVAIDAGMPIPGITSADPDDPDVGAYQHNADLWQVGSTLPHVTKAPTELEVSRNPDGHPVLR